METVCGEEKFINEMSFGRISRNLNIAPSTAHHMCKQFNESGSIASHYGSERKELRLLDEHMELCSVGLVMSKSSMYLHEVCQEAFNCRVYDLSIA